MIFRCHSLHQVGHIVKVLLLNFHPSTVNSDNLAAVATFAAPLMLLQLGEFWTNDIFFILKKHWLICNCILVIMAYLLMEWGVTKAQEFIYFQF